ncbi:MAG: cytochrome c biogenesis protein DipZ [Candidatus Pacebacteria bacterium]|jgi:cytochrome c biogenesis protein CcdA/thiol-disulfide isomerase/thioredoxin|nr:cytochrome c biogenesis protein DipZ [Candidatus Paceibacterota bacterium]MBT4652168.1 cytochrome c biogenesis protein DipZ [Candidatus Paceibacterota bacterium]MBT6756706.1 cytochrome c biogenesis protein DipZ [Candidatus Paceibacterota bacterium]MBT6920976.1 cytochrome c biogenesis protein DipZ [Candidatus Paceibacterota bacterium]
MFLLLIFAFLAGVVTVLSPCILPLLPIILSSSDGSGKQKPLGVVTGFITSFTFFTLFLSLIVRSIGISADSLRFVSIFILGVFGASLLIPGIQSKIEILFSRFSSSMPSSKNRTGFVGGFIIGLSLGLLWTPCVGPILASVISLAITGTVTAQSFLITLAYAVGTALPMLGIMIAGSTALQKVPWLLRNTKNIQKGFGILMIATAVGIFFNFDRSFQTFILDKFPNYGIGLTSFEDNQKVKNQLDKLNKSETDEDMFGKPSSELIRKKGVPAPEIILGGQWFNSEPLSISDLRGKVVLIDFWTYSCINCQRTFPYLKNWWEKYQDDNLVIIGVHSPEFEFEKNSENVQQALNDFGITYPVMQDNNFSTWKTYKNRYWPAKYLIDKDGNIRYTHFGEGDYDETEKKIQELLEETGSEVSSKDISNVDYKIKSRTPETYLGYERVAGFASLERVSRNKKNIYTLPSKLGSNLFAYEGEWTFLSEYSSPEEGSKLHLNFESKEVFLVARPKGGESRFKVYLDGELKSLGEDVIDGFVTVDSDKLYKIINLPASGRHELQLEFLDSNIEVYAFTFG